MTSPHPAKGWHRLLQPRAWLPPLLLLALAGGLLAGWRALRQLPEPSPLRQDEAAALLQAARAAVAEGVAARMPSAHPTPPRAGDPKADPATLVFTPSQATAAAAAAQAVLEQPLAHAVMVTVYTPSDEGRPEPGLGFWPRQNAPKASTLLEAVREAGRQAGERLASKRENVSLDQARIKLDLAGAPQGTGGLSESWLEPLLDPGRTGLMVQAGDQQAWLPPSLPLERQWRLPIWLKRLRGQLEKRAVEPQLMRFRSQAWVEGTLDEPGPLPLFRGNVLVPEVNPETLRRSLRLAGAYLTRMVGKDGRYCYTYLADEDRCDKDYNLLRHAGTTYSLFQIQGELPTPSQLEAAERATAWLRAQVREVEGDPSRAYLLEGQRAKLGAVGLAMLALVEREKVVKDGQDRALLTRLADFVLSQQRPDGYLYSYFAWKKDVVVPKENSIYYPGEALLGLVRLYSIDPQPRYLEAARLTARFLALKRWTWGGVEVYVPPDAWLTQALAELYPLLKDDDLKAYTYKLVEVTRLSTLQAEEGAPVDMAGGPVGGWNLPAVTPAGSRNEGLTAAWRMATQAGDTAQAQAILALSVQSARFQLSQQFRPANSYYLPNPARALGGFRSQADKLDIRIDYVQHNVTGLLGLMHILETP